MRLSAPPTEHPQTIVSLTSVHRAPCAKTLGFAEGRVGVVASYGQEDRWRIGAHNVATFADMAAVLAGLASRGDCIVIRGSYDPAAEYDPDLGVLRRLKGSPYGGGHWSPCARTWVPVDLDGVVVEDLGSVEATLSGLVERFPAPFRGVSFWYQFTSSHGLDGEGATRLRVRLWFFASAPITDAGLALAFAPHLTPLNVDPCIWRAVQPIYVCAPTMQGDLADPIHPRTGIVWGFDGDTVDASAFAEGAASSAVGAFMATRPALTRAPHPTEVANARERVLNSKTEGSRHMHAVGAAVEMLGLGDAPDNVATLVAELIRKQGREPASGEVHGVLAWACQRIASGRATTDNPPAASLLPDEAEGEDAPPKADAVDAPPVDEDATAPGDPGPTPEEGDVGAAVYDANANANAHRYLRVTHPLPPESRAFHPAPAGYSLARFGEVDYEWDGARYRPLEGEELAGRIQHAVGVAVEGTVSAVRRLALIAAPRDERTGVKLSPPFWRSPRPGDADPRMLVSFRNGVLDLSAWVLDPSTPLRPHDPRLFTLASLPYDFAPSAKCPAFHAWIEGTFPDEESRRELRKMLGYCFLPSNPLHRLFVLSGAPRSGKGVTQRLIRALVGPDACAALSLQGLGGTFGLAALLGKRVAIIGEANDQRRSAALDLAVDRMKAISGGDSVDVDRKNKDIVSADLGTRFVLACNTFPAFLDPSGALLDRLSVLRFLRTHAGREDRDLEARLHNEVQGVANVALAGLRDVLCNGFTNPPAVREYIAEVRGVLSPVAAFVEDCVVHDPEAARVGFVASSVMYSSYLGWCAAHRSRPVPLERFATDLRAILPDLRTGRAKPGDGGGRRRGYEAPGLALTADGQTFADGGAGFPADASAAGKD